MSAHLQVGFSLQTWCFGLDPLSFCEESFVDFVHIGQDEKMGTFSASSGSLTRSTSSLCFNTILERLGEDCKLSALSQREQANASQLFGMTLAPKNEEISMQRVWPTEHAWDATTCGYSFE